MLTVRVTLFQSDSHFVVMPAVEHDGGEETIVYDPFVTVFDRHRAEFHIGGIRTCCFLSSDFLSPALRDFL